MTDFDVTRVERETAEHQVISSIVKKPVQNREKSTYRDYLLEDATQLLKDCDFLPKSILHTGVILSFVHRSLRNNGPTGPSESQKY